MSKLESSNIKTSQGKLVSVPHFTNLSEDTILNCIIKLYGHIHDGTYYIEHNLTDHILVIRRLSRETNKYNP